MSTSEPLLGGPDGAAEREQPYWSRNRFFGSTGSRRKDDSLAFDEKMPHRMRLGPRRCTIIGLAVLVVLYVQNVLTAKLTC